MFKMNEFSYVFMRIHKYEQYENTKFFLLKTICRDFGPIEVHFSRTKFTLRAVLTQPRTLNP